jgi:uncharacterized protein (DUF1697 family)
MGVHIALLRAINVGGKNLVPMRELAPMFSDAGCTDVQIYIQSGNVVFCAKDAAVRRVAAQVSKALVDRFGFEVPVLTRSAAELRDVVKKNPFLRSGVPVETLHVAYLADTPSAARIAALDPDRSPPDRFEVRGREIYLHYPNGGGRSKLNTTYFDTRLATTTTVRNWRTTLKLLDLADAIAK